MSRRVLITAQSGAFAGVERRLVQEAQALGAMGVQVCAAPSRFPRAEQFREQLVQAGAELLDWHPYKFIERQQAGFPFPQLCALSIGRIARCHLDLAHVAMPWTTVGLSRVWALSRARVPVVLGLHCTYDKARWPGGLTPFIAEALKGVVGAYAVSQSVKDSFLVNFAEWVDADRIEVIHNGVDVDRFAPNASQAQAWRASHGLPRDARLVVFCGRLDPFKDPGFALDVFEAAAKVDAQLHLAIAGDGPLAASLRERVSASGTLAGRVTFLGFIDKVEALLRAGDAYLSTSTPHEGFPLAPSEALASGLPILIPEQAVFREAFGTCPSARLVAGRNPADWALALADIVSGASPGASTQASQAARDYALARLTTQRMTSRLQSFYRAWI